jgi:hypothetical protein
MQVLYPQQRRVMLARAVTFEWVRPVIEAQQMGTEVVGGVVESRTLTLPKHNVGKMLRRHPLLSLHGGMFEVSGIKVLVCCLSHILFILHRNPFLKVLPF